MKLMANALNVRNEPISQKAYPDTKTNRAGRAWLETTLWSFSELKESNLGARYEEVCLLRNYFHEKPRNLLRWNSPYRERAQDRVKDIERGGEVTSKPSMGSLPWMTPRPSRLILNPKVKLLQYKGNMSSNFLHAFLPVVPRARRKQGSKALRLCNQ